MTRKELFKKVAVFTLATSLCLSVVGATTVFAEDNTPADEQTADAPADEKTATDAPADEKTATEDQKEDQKEEAQTAKEDKKEEAQTAKEDQKEDDAELSDDNPLNTIAKEGNGKYVFTVTGVKLLSGVHGISEEEEAKIEKQLLAAFDKVDVELKDGFVTLTNHVKPFKLNEKDSYINKIETYMHANDAAEPKLARLKPTKNDKGQPTAFTFSFDMNKCHESVLQIFINSNDESADKENYEPGKDLFAVTLDVDVTKVIEGSQDAGKQLPQVIADKPNDKTKDAVKNNLKKSAKKDKSPKTADAMSTGVMASLIGAGMSIVVLAGLFVYRRRSNI